MNRTMRAALAVAALSLLSTTAAWAQSRTLLIRNATILTAGPTGTIARGSVLIREGRIAAVGPTLDVPSGVEVVDGTGMYLMPGIVDCHSHIAVEGGINESTLSVTSMTSVTDVLNPDDINIYRGLAGGVTTSNVLHGSANPIGGQSQVIKLRWGKDADDLRFAGALPGLKLALGENPKRRGQPGSAQPLRYPGTRMGTLDVIRRALLDARAYRASWQEYRARAKRDPKTQPPRRNLTLEPLVEVLEGKRLAHAHGYRADELLQLMRLAEEFGFRIATLQHALEGYKIADEIAAHGAGASTFADFWAFKLEAYDAIPYNAALMMERGVLVSINSDSAERQRHLNQEAAKAVRYGGVSEDEAIKLITINPARQLRIDSRVGSIEVGKDADLVLYDKHPLSVYATPQKVWIDGTMYFDRARELTDHDTRAAEMERLLERARSRSRQPATPTAPPSVRSPQPEAPR